MPPSAFASLDSAIACQTMGSARAGVGSGDPFGLHDQVAEAFALRLGRR